MEEEELESPTKKPETRKVPKAPSHSGTVREIAHIGLPSPHHILPNDEKSLMDSFAPAAAFFKALGLTYKVVDLGGPKPHAHDRSASCLRVHVTKYGNPRVLFSFASSTLTATALKELVGPGGALQDLHLAISVAPAQLSNTIKRLGKLGHHVEHDTTWGPGHRGVHVTGPWGYCFELQVSNGDH
ncbi:MAG: VOC family protein [bacterium]|nr:VOC family protein [bacterium]